MIPRRMLLMKMLRLLLMHLPGRRHCRQMHNFELDWQRIALEEQHAQGESCGDRRGARGKLMEKQKMHRSRTDFGQRNILISDRQHLHRRLGQPQRHRRI